MSEQNYPSYLIHYGIEGQKWGVRRFQNEDGTYTDEGNLRRREQKYFVKAQEKVGKKFDKYTEKIKKDQQAGKKISDRRVKKALMYGTKHRMYDYISKNPQPYLKARGLDRASAAKSATKIVGGAIAIGSGIDYYYYPKQASLAITAGSAALASGIYERKIEKMAINKWMRRQYGEVLSKSRSLTLKDLESHGIKLKNKNKTSWQFNTKFDNKYIKKMT